MDRARPQRIGGVGRDLGHAGAQLGRRSRREGEHQDARGRHAGGEEVSDAPDEGRGLARPRPRVDEERAGGPRRRLGLGRVERVRGGRPRRGRPQRRQARGPHRLLRHDVHRQAEVAGDLARAAAAVDDLAAEPVAGAQELAREDVGRHLATLPVRVADDARGRARRRVDGGDLGRLVVMELVVADLVGDHDLAPARPQRGVDADEEADALVDAEDPRPEAGARARRIPPRGLAAPPWPRRSPWRSGRRRRRREPRHGRRAP